MQPMLLAVEGSGAEFSSDRKYRYTLWREWDKSKGTVAFVGLNPSTADETRNDPTVRRCINYAKMWGYGKMFMLNIFGFRATDPKVMKAEKSPVGPDNMQKIMDTVKECDLVVGCWGSHGVHSEQGRLVWDVLNSEGVKVHTFGVTKSGHPKHPLYLSKNLKVKLFEGF